MKIVQLNILVSDDAAQQVASNLRELASTYKLSLEENTYDDQILERAVTIVDFGESVD